MLEEVLSKAPGGLGRYVSCALSCGFKCTFTDGVSTHTRTYTHTYTYMYHEQPPATPQLDGTTLHHGGRGQHRGTGQQQRKRECEPAAAAARARGHGGAGLAEGRGRALGGAAGCVRLRLLFWLLLRTSIVVLAMPYSYARPLGPVMYIHI